MFRLGISRITPLKVTALALLCLLTLSMTAHTNTAAVPLSTSLATATPKDETVFVNLQSDGAVKQVHVVNTFREVSGAIGDFGDYAEVVNLSNTLPIALRADHIAMALSENEATVFRYQGRLNAPTLPWLFSFAYTLDGALVSASDLLGQSGLLGITINVSPNPLSVRHFSDHYTVQVVVPLLVDRVKAVQAEGASAMLVGNRLNLAFTVMPGESHSQIIYATVRDFAMPPIEISALRLARPQGAWLDDLDTGFLGLVDGMQGVIAGTTSLQNGLTALHGGVGELHNSLDPLVTHMGQFTTGLEQSAGGMAAFSRGLAEIQGGQTTLSAAEQQVLAVLPTLQGGYMDIAAGAGALTAEGAQIRVLAESLISSPDPLVSKLAATTLMQLTAIEGLVAGLTQTNAGLAAYAEARVQLEAQRTALSEGLSKAVEAARVLSGGLGELSQAGVIIQGGVAELPRGTALLYSRTAALPQHVAGLVAGQRQLADGLTQARANLGQFFGDGPVVPVVSFASPERAKATSVQFVMITPPVEAASRKRAQDEVAIQTTLWQRIVELARRFVDLF